MYRYLGQILDFFSRFRTAFLYQKWNQALARRAGYQEKGGLSGDEKPTLT